ncbi:hypothetical protein A9Q97_02625 [Rhodospirillales bacterium 47_12_T64]|nr:hypothetical protein A9Q97_02625 [Rhodospirillales bacterium 47_12_T64]
MENHTVTVTLESYSLTREVIKNLSNELHFHGLRKSAAVALAEAGCTERQIMSITGHKSVAMVSHYTKKVDQKKQEKQAIIKLSQA